MTLAEEIKQAMGKQTLVLGKNSVLKQLRQGKLAKVVLALNCDSEVREDIIGLCELDGVEYQESKATSEDLGALCKRSHWVSALGFKK